MSVRRQRTPGPFERDDLTLRLYATLALIGFLLNGLGSILAPLQRDLDTSREQVAFYPSLFAAALILVGVAGGPVVRRIGDRRGLLTAFAGIGLGVVLLAVPSRPVTLVGAVVLGVFAALAIQLVPAGLSRRHPVHATAAIGEANAASSFASLVAPALVALALVAGLTWRLGYTLPAVVVVVVLFVRGLRARSPADLPAAAPGEDTETGLGLEPGRLVPRWAAVFLAVSAEFCLVFWAAAAFDDWHDASPGAAAALAGTFLLGMAVARAFASRLTAGRHPTTVVLASCVVALLGFGLFWGSPTVAPAGIGLFVTGTGIALIYPATISRLVAAWPHDRNAAAATGALASGTAIGIPPLVLAYLADEVGMRTAYLIVPGLLVLLAVLVLVAANPARARPGQPAETSTTPTSAATTPTC